jgi:flagellar basal-body rod modification protein FlgD
MTSPVSGASATAYTPPTTTVDRPDQMGRDTFLKLLVAQLRYQDPANPTDSSTMMSQTAVFTQVEKLEQIATQNAALLVLQEHATAGALVGRTVTYTDATGASASGRVTSVRLASSSGEATAMVGDLPVPVGRITEIAQPATS